MKACDVNTANGSHASLNLCCGCGVPGTQLLADRYSVTGVDISPVQIERARILIPKARLIRGDMMLAEFEPASFDAVVSFYALIHVPLQEQQLLLAKVARWLRPGGCLLATVGHDAWTGTQANWLGIEGATMFWSHADEATYLRWLEDLALQVQWHRFIPEGSGGHTLILAEKIGDDEIR